jgi:hypothetical protein
MPNAMSFFRVFDLAFFAPGALLLVGLYFAEMIQVPSAWAEGKVSTVSGLTALVAAVGGAYLLGLLLHGVGEIFGWVIKRVHGEGLSTKAKRSWYQALPLNDATFELALYFWYTRATCWNLCLSCALLVVVAIPSHKWQLFWLVVPGAIFAFLGSRYNEALHRITLENRDSLP